jgi:putative PEP-CTERM system histidine kinase
LALENLYRNSSIKFRWAIKYFCFGLGTILVYDFFLYADGALFGHLDQEFFDGRGFANAIIVPLLAISVSRATMWDIDIHISRTAVFHTTALIGSGIYLIGMAGIGFYVREIGGEWGRVLQNLLLASTVLILVIIFSSSAMRAKFKVWISKHFFSYKYDYREEWLRFIRTITSTDGPAGLHERIVRSVGDIVDCSAGGLWILRHGDNAFLPTVTMQLGDRPPAQSLYSPLVRFLSETHW